MFKPIVFLFVLQFISSCINSEGKNKAVSMTHINKFSQTELQISMDKGNTVYQDFCVQCHMTTGEGVPNTFPPLAGSDYLFENRSKNIHAVKYGQQGELVVNGVIYNGLMPPMGLSDVEVADVLNYVMNSWGNSQMEMITEDEVRAVEK